MQEEHQALKEERWELLSHINQLTDKPITALAFVWIGLLILDLVQGLGPLLEALSYIIWAIFILDFVIEFTIAPEKTTYLRKNWLTAISLVLPALRVFRIFRAFRALRAIRTIRTVGLLRLVTSINRSMRATAAALGKRSIGYVFAVTIIVIFAGAAGMAYFESPSALRQAGYVEEAERGAGIESYGESVWWTAMIMTTLGSEYWPQTVEGRVLCWLLSIYAFAVFGYITATIASLFIGSAGQPAKDDSLREEITALRAQVASLTALLESKPPSGITAE